MIGHHRIFILGPIDSCVIDHDYHLTCNSVLCEGMWFGWTSGKGHWDMQCWTEVWIRSMLHQGSTDIKQGYLLWFGLGIFFPWNRAIWYTFAAYHKSEELHQNFCGETLLKTCQKNLPKTPNWRQTAFSDLVKKKKILSQHLLWHSYNVACQTCTS